MEFYRAELPYYTCGFWVDDDNVIIDAAPIMYWAIGRKLESFDKFVRFRKGRVVKLDDGQNSLIGRSEGLHSG